jgi:hypothetical protein
LALPAVLTSRYFLASICMAASGNHEPKDVEAVNESSGAAPSAPLVVQTIGVGAIVGQEITVGAIEVPGITAESIHILAVQAPSLEAPRAEVNAIEVAECVVEPVRSTEIQAAHRPEISRWRRPLRKNERTSNVFGLPILLGKLRSLWWWAVILVVAASDGRREPRQTPHLVSQLTLNEHVGV